MRALSEAEEQNIRQAAVMETPVSQPTRMNEQAYDLKTGLPVEAARGIKDRMQARPLLAIRKSLTVSGI
jgi:hypothetical protein